MIMDNETALDLWQIIAHYGYRNQKEKAVEELGELQRALARDLQGKQERKTIAEEMADCYIMLAQLQLIYGNRPEVQEEIARKIARTLQTVEKEWSGGCGG